MSSSANDSCKLSHTTGNTTDPFHLGNPYGGLPQNLITNSIGVAIILLLFLVLRKRSTLAWIMRTDDLERIAGRVLNVTADTIEKGIDQVSAGECNAHKRIKVRTCSHTHYWGICLVSCVFMLTTNYKNI